MQHCSWPWSWFILLVLVLVGSLQLILVLEGDALRALRLMETKLRVLVLNVKFRRCLLIHM